MRDSYKVFGAVWFSLIDVPGANSWAERTGLLRSNGSEKPSWASLEYVTGAR